MSGGDRIVDEFYRYSGAALPRGTAPTTVRGEVKRGAGSVRPPTRSEGDTSDPSLEGAPAVTEADLFRGYGPPGAPTLTLALPADMTAGDVERVLIAYLREVRRQRAEDEYLADAERARRLPAWAADGMVEELAVGTVMIYQTELDPGDFGDPRIVTADGITHVAVPSFSLWPRSEQ